MEMAWRSRHAMPGSRSHRRSLAEVLVDLGWRPPRDRIMPDRTCRMRHVRMVRPRMKARPVRVRRVQSHIRRPAEPPSARVGRLGSAGCSTIRWKIRCGWGCSAGAAGGWMASARAACFLDASHFKYQAGATARLVLAAWASTPAKPVFVGLDAAAADSGDAWAGFWPASASAAWPAAAGHLRRPG